MPSRLPRTPLAWALALMLGACSSVPERPAPDVPEAWFHAVRQQPADAEALADWWQQFDDPMLTRTVRLALENNRDIRLAMLRVDSARSQLRQARAGLFPTFDLPGSASRQWIENNNEPDPNSPVGQFVPDEDVITFDNWELALQASWELDIFGATRARTDSARQQIRSAQAQAIAARLAVASNAAQGYMQLRALEGQRALLVEGIELAADLERIAGRLFEAGEVTRLDVAASAAERASLEADLDELDINLAEARLALDTLLAEPPGSTARQLEASTKVPLADKPIPPGQPLDLLRRRPDLIAEAAQLQAAQLQSLAARRDLFPTLAVQAAVGRSGLALGDAFSTASNFARLGATFGLPFLDYRRRGAAIDLADVEGESAYIGFQQALAEAMEEVERSLVRLEGQQRRLHSLGNTLRHREYAYELAQKSYRLGEANLNEVLDAQRGSLQARQQALQGRTALATAQVAMFVALGGGWEMEPDAVSDTDANNAGETPEHSEQ
ncbi:efflux transporter outer membrane subunit [Stutzerimonas zhaodongensis]|uniref:efflux transporter outer membrane subunit n=1 Tax=Stutzerimonas zhaodongensis TaxID=1176257 RepID=UPI0021043CD8|nr:efflux transporter outer membrane subunit [Stutzerimonas zhaodongensis]MCQ2030147.1 efflux transporter outer membrane subunit [Stutzerimonas zhaodongensis]